MPNPMDARNSEKGWYTETSDAWLYDADGEPAGRPRYPSRSLDDHLSLGWTAEHAAAAGDASRPEPPGYWRSDAEIHSEVWARFDRQIGALAGSRVRVLVRQGEIILEGRVLNRNQRALAEELADSVYGVMNVHNRLKVQESLDSAAAG